jgi:hypothetical protein
MLNKVVKIEILSGHRLRIVFADGSAGEHKFIEMVKEPGEMIEPLRDPKFFSRVFLEYGAPTWPNGYDICPDWLHMTMETAGEIRHPATVK